MSFKEITGLASVSFQKVKCVTYERYKLLTRTQESGETLEAFHAALTAQAARSELEALESEIVRDLFISKMKNMTLQDTLQKIADRGSHYKVGQVYKQLLHSSNCNSSKKR